MPGQGVTLRLLCFINCGSQEMEGWRDRGMRGMEGWGDWGMEGWGMGVEGWRDGEMEG